MPWTCGACQVDLTDDAPTCPTCGATKESWTVHFDQTRALQITRSRARMEVLRGVSADTLPKDDARNVSFETVPAEVCPVLPKARLLATVEAGHLPAPNHRIVARVFPKKLDRTVTFGVDFAAGEMAEHEVDGEEYELSGEGAFDVQYVCVFGPEDVSALEVGDLQVIDVGEETEAGYAPDVEVSALRKTKELPTELVGKPGVALLEVEDICFATKREILLAGGWSASDDLTGLSVVAGALEYARKHPERRLLLAGHADKRGSIKDNQVLSEDRARNVYLYLTGKRDEWAAHCQEHFEVEDLQSELKWIAWLHQWDDCDPGNIDGKWGDGSNEALKTFRARYNEEYQGSLDVDAKQSVADWAAFYDMYDEELAFKLKTDREHLTELRGALTFTDPPFIGCSEHWPTERPDAPKDDAAHRRVDVLFFPAADLPDLPGEPPGEAIYGPENYDRNYLSVDDAFREPEPPYGNAPFEDVDCPFKTIHTEVEPDPPEAQIDRNVYHDVPLLSFKTVASSPLNCAAMLVAWRDELKLDVGEISSRSGPWEPYKEALDKEEDDDEAVSDFGLSAKGSATYRPQALVELLEGQGPLWVTGTDEVASHVRLLTGITQQEGRVNVYFNDPAPGRGKVSMPFETFAFEMDRRATEPAPEHEVALTVAHT